MTLFTVIRITGIKTTNYVLRPASNRLIGRHFNKVNGLLMEGAVNYHLTRAVKANAEREKYLNMPLAEKRKLYRDGHVSIENIETWPSYAKNIEQDVVVGTESKYDVDDVLNAKISLWSGDITKLEIDAIVNAANSSLMGGGGVDGCIHRAAGPLLGKECGTLGGCSAGNAKTTCGYNLPARYVIHTVGPMGENGERLRACYTRCFEEARDNGVRSLAFPCISTGIYGYPNDRAAHVALNTTRTWLNENADKIDRVIFCLFLRVDVDIYDQLMHQYFPLEKSNLSGHVGHALSDVSRSSSDDNKIDPVTSAVHPVTSTIYPVTSAVYSGTSINQRQPNNQ